MVNARALLATLDNLILVDGEFGQTLSEDIADYVKANNMFIELKAELLKSNNEWDMQSTVNMLNIAIFSDLSNLAIAVSEHQSAINESVKIKWDVRAGKTDISLSYQWHNEFTQKFKELSDSNSNAIHNIKITVFACIDDAENQIPIYVKKDLGLFNEPERIAFVNALLNTPDVAQLEQQYVQAKHEEYIAQQNKQKYEAIKEEISKLAEKIGITVNQLKEML